MGSLISWWRLFSLQHLMKRASLFEFYVQVDCDDQIYKEEIEVSQNDYRGITVTGRFDRLATSRDTC